MNRYIQIDLLTRGQVVINIENISYIRKSADRKNFWLNIGSKSWGISKSTYEYLASILLSYDSHEGKDKPVRVIR